MKYVLLLVILLLSGCSNGSYSERSVDAFDSYNSPDVVVEDSLVVDDYDSGYQWAEDEDISDFDDCQNQFGTGDAEDGCNDYVKENYTGSQEFMGYECTEDCSGHEAGYDWASDNDINDEYDCDGNSDSFNEGCQAYVEENY